MALGVGQCQALQHNRGLWVCVCVDMDNTEVDRVPGVSGCAETDGEERYGGRRGWMIDIGLLGAFSVVFRTWTL